MNKSNGFISQCQTEVQKWEIDSSYSICVNSQTLFNYPQGCQNSYFFDDLSKLFLSIQDDQIVVSLKDYIFFLLKEMDGTWNCIHKMILHFEQLTLNELGNILLIKKFKEASWKELEIVVYVKNKLEQWTTIQKIKADWNDNFYFLDYEQFAIVDRNTNQIIIWQIALSNLEFTLIQKLKFNQQQFDSLFNIIVLKSSELIITQSFEYFYILTNNNNQLQIKKHIETDKKILAASHEGFLFNNQDIHSHEYQAHSSGRIGIFKIYKDF